MRNCVGAPDSAPIHAGPESAYFSSLSARIDAVVVSDEPAWVTDPFDLNRFVDAQDDGDTYGQALRELRAGSKRSHWMWFIFPQIAGLGMSETSRHFAISGLAEAQAYLAHPVLGPRLIESASALADLDGVSAVQVFGPVDAQKLRSSMTLFARAASDQQVFRDVLARYFGGETDEATISRL